MAERSALRLPRLPASFDLGLSHLATEVASLPRRVPRQRPTGPALHRLLWRLLWLPYWLGSDVPAPQLPARDATPPAEIGLAGEHVLRILDGLARRIWLQRALSILARALWLGLLVGCVLLLLERQGGLAFHGELLLPVTAVSLLISLIFVALARPTRRQVARMLDRSFGLHERMMTAVDHLGRAVPAEGERASVTYLQMADAANVVADFRGHPAFAIRPPLREIVAGIACALLMAALFFLRGVGGGIPPAAAGTVPEFVPAADRVAEEAAAAQAQAQAELADAPTAAEVQERAERSNAARQDLERLADALGDQAVTRPAADAIQRGDYAAAAAELRSLASDADQISSGSRQDLASNLEQAASEMSEGQDGLAEASQAAADGLREGDQAAEEGVRELGEAVDRAGENVASQQELAEQMRQAEAAEENAAQGQQGESDVGEPGEQGQSGQPGQDQTQGQPGAEGEPVETASESEGNQAGDNGEAGQPGEGLEPGQQGEQPGQGEGQPGAEGGSRSQRDGAGAEGAGSDPGDQGQPRGQAGQADGEQAGQGGGAGSGEQQPNQGETQSGAGDDSATTQGPPPEEQVTEGEGAANQPAETAPLPPSEAVQLPRSSGQGVQTSNNAGSSSIGSGTGAAAASGTTVQGEVGDAGPDSNRVPPGYRSVVEDYFSDPSGQP